MILVISKEKFMITTNTIRRIIIHLRDPFHSPFILPWTLGWFRPRVKSYCPICNAAGIFAFADSFWGGGGMPKRINVICPSCGSEQRHRFVWLCLQNYWNMEQKSTNVGKNLLHFAPERCFKKRFARWFGNDNYMTGDIELGRAKKVIDITNICFPEGTYDYIVCNHVLEHISDDKKAISELYRVLKKTGIAFLSVPLKGQSTDEDLTVTDPNERMKRFGAPSHVRYYGHDFKNRLESAGFSVSVITPDDIVVNKNLQILLGIHTESLDENTLFIAQKLQQ